MIKSLSVKIIPIKEQRQTTGGRWEYDQEGNCLILISDMTNKVFIIPVIFHEMIEMFWCVWKGITTEQADEFDDYYETLYASGKVPIGNDAGDDPKCPYYQGHQYGIMFERLVCWMLGIDWKEYCDAWEKLYKEK